jgi:L-arabinose isomerase
MNDLSKFSVSSTLAQRAPRIAVVAGYMPYFEEIMPPDFRATMAARGAASAQRLEGMGEVLFTGLVHDYQSGFEAGQKIKAFQPDVVVLAPTMAAPAGYQYAAVRDIGRIPVVLLNIHELETIPRDYTAHSIVPNSVTVGCMMINSLLRREGRWSPVITGHAGNPETWERARSVIRSAAIAGRFSKARFGVLGTPLDGYLHVLCDPGALASGTGANLVQVSADEFTDTWRAIDASSVNELAAAYRDRVKVDIRHEDEDEYLRSVRLALTLESIVCRHDLVGGTFNCRNEYGVLNPEIGVLGCLANSHLTTHGYPFTCTGDIVTAIAMYLGKQLGGDSYYCELDTVDYIADAVLCANTGEGDFRQADGCTGCAIRKSGHESGRYSPGCNIHYDMPHRAGTAVAFSPRLDAPGGHVIIAAEGSIEGTPDTQLSLPSMYFRFKDTPIDRAMSRWIEAGAVHHTGISSGHFAEDLELVARLVGIGFERIS